MWGCSTYDYIGKVYQSVAIIHGEPMDHLAEVVVKNVWTFFAKQLGQRH